MLDWIFAGISFIGCILNIKKNIYCWPIWTIASIGFAIDHYYNGKWALMIYFATYIPMNIYGYLIWRKDERI